MKKKFLMAFTICMGMLNTSIFAMEKTDVDMFYYSRNMNLENDIYTENGQYFIPLRECAELLGATVDYTKDKIMLHFSDFSDFDYVEYRLNENKVFVGSEENKGQVVNINGVSYVNIKDFFALFDNGVVEMDDSGKKVLFVRYSTVGIPNEVIPLEKTNINFNTSLSLLNVVPKNQNGAVSPISMKLSLAMLANGATGQSQKEILNVLGYDTLEQLNNFVSNEAMKWTVDEKRTDENFEKQPNQGEILFCNGLWYNSGEQKTAQNIFSEGFQNTAQNIFHGTAKTVNNANAVRMINEWAKQSTKGFLPKIIENADFKTALINTAYFKCCWYKEFEPEATKKATFYNIDNSKSEIDFMNKWDSALYCETDGWQMVNLYYKDARYSMYLFLPKKGNYQPLDNEMINKLLSYDTTMRVKIEMPKIDIESEYDMTEALKAMGLHSMYQLENNQDFSGMFSDGVNRAVDKTIQRTKITVNEHGTEAAAATQHRMAGAGRVLTEPPVFQANRPFYYMITKTTGNSTVEINEEVLFIGQYVTAKQ